MVLIFRCNNIKQIGYIYSAYLFKIHTIFTIFLPFAGVWVINGYRLTSLTLGMSTVKCFLHNELNQFPCVECISL